MPHFGLIDDTLDPEEAALLRARLHVRGANARMNRGQTADAIAALYDAFSTAMDLHLLRISDRDGSKAADDREAFAILSHVGILDAPMDEFAVLEKTLDEAIAGRTSEGSFLRFLSIVEHMLIRLGIVPFPEATLPEGESVTT